MVLCYHRINSWCHFAHYRSHIHIHQMSRVCFLYFQHQFYATLFPFYDCLWLLWFLLTLWLLFFFFYLFELCVPKSDGVYNLGIKDENIYHRRVCATNRMFQWINHNRICRAICCIRVRPPNKIYNKTFKKKVDYCGPHWHHMEQGILWQRGESNDIPTTMIITKSSTIITDRLWERVMERHVKFQLRWANARPSSAHEKKKHILFIIYYLHYFLLWKF